MNMMNMDPHKILGVRKNASPRAIQKAYRKLAFELHPDRNPGDSKAEERFKAVQAAYDALTGKKDRQQEERGRALVLKALAEKFMAVLQAFSQRGTDPTTQDIVKLMRECFDAEVGTLEKAKREIQTAMANAEKMLGRFQVSDGEENVFEGSLRSKLREWPEQLAKIDAAIVVMKEARSFLTKCKYKFEPGRSPQGYMGNTIWNLASVTGS